MNVETFMWFLLGVVTGAVALALAQILMLGLIERIRAMRDRT